MNYEDWLRRPVRLAEIRAYKIYCDMLVKGEVPSTILHPSKLYRATQPKVKIARDLVAAKIKQQRKEQRNEKWKIQSNNTASA